jgi:hypothetical protein
MVEVAFNCGQGLGGVDALPGPVYLPHMNRRGAGRYFMRPLLARVECASV